MKLKIKIHNYTELPFRYRDWEKGDWIDLRINEDVELKKGEFKILSLGVAMQLPKGFTAIVAPRSSTFKNWNILQTNSIGIIDNSYCGDKDIWGFPALAMDYTHILKGSRICQFTIVPSLKATFWQKLKWLFCTGIEFENVESLDNKNRGGFGSTGI